LEYTDHNAPLLFYSGDFYEEYNPFEFEIIEKNEITLDAEAGYGYGEKPFIDYIKMNLLAKDTAKLTGKVFVVYQDLQVGAIGEDKGPVPSSGFAAIDVKVLNASDFTETLTIELHPEILEPTSPYGGISNSDYSEYENLKTILAGELLAFGLTDKETEAFMRAWENTFFGVQGNLGYPTVGSGKHLNVIAMHEQEVYDELMPLTIEPAPDELVRVLFSYTTLFEEASLDY